jgi:hypothetical protein
MTPPSPAIRPSRPGLRERIWTWALRRSRPHPTPPAGRHPALLLFEAADPAMTALSVRIEAMLSARGYQVERLGYFPDRAEHPEADYSHFNHKALAWNGCPQGPLIDGLFARSWSLAVGLHQGSCPPVQWLIRRLPARLRIGPAAGEPVYQLTLDGHRDNPRGFADHLEQLLQTMENKVHVRT